MWVINKFWNKGINFLSCIGINIAQVMKKLLWFENALASAYQRQLWYSNTIVKQSHDEMVTTFIDRHNPLNEEQQEENQERKENKRYSNHVLEWK
jgi:hypothetical protein